MTLVQPRKPPPPVTPARAPGGTSPTTKTPARAEEAPAVVRAPVEAGRQAAARALSVAQAAEKAAVLLRRVGERAADALLDLPRPWEHAGPPPVDIDGIVANDDPVARNRDITQAYHDLSDQMGALTGTDNANWATFGQWASSGAGEVIRGEGIPDLPTGLDNGLRQDVMDAVADGNRKIFADVAPGYQAFIQEFSTDTSWKQNPEAGRRRLEEMLGRAPFADKSPEYREAFRCYYEAMVLNQHRTPENDQKRAELMMKGNVLIADHEQRVAQHEVERAIPEPGIPFIGDRVREWATSMVTFPLPGGDLHVSDDVARRPPADLAHIDDPWLRDYAERMGQDVDSARHSDAPNWRDFEERMGYIFNVFRAYQQADGMFEGPPEVR